MRAINFARDAHPERTPGEVMDEVSMTTPPIRLGDWSGGLAAQVDAGRPRSWEELDCPDEIELELADATPVALYLVTRAMEAAGLSVDQVFVTPLPANISVYLTKQGEDCWYAGVPRGRRLVLRRI